MNGTRRTIALVSLLALAAIGITQGMMHGQPGSAGGGMPGMPGMMTTAPTDELGFLQHMIPHHREAIATAEALLEVTERPELRELLENVIETQSEEVERMEGWIAEWYPGADPEALYTPMMRDLGPDATVADRERVWLEDMVMHHMMAVRDARMLLAGGFAEHPEVEALARDIVASQTSEMQTMSGWLADWFGVSGMQGIPEMMGGQGMMGGQAPFGAAGDQGASDAPGTQRGFEVMPGQAGFGMMHGPSGMRGGMMHGPGGMGGEMMHPGLGGMGGFSGMMHPGFGAMGRFAGHGVANGMSPATAEALARAFLAGRGEGGSVVEVAGPRVTYEVSYQAGDRTGVLLIDAQTGEVSEAPAE